jgi:hypothetical protein
VITVIPDVARDNPCVNDCVILNAIMVLTM